MSKINYAMIGAAGRMGQAIIKLARDLKMTDGTEFHLVGALEHPRSASLGQSVQAVTDQTEQIRITTDAPAVIRRVQVAIDFSSPTNTLQMAELCAKHGVALIVGTTGFTPPQKDRLLAYCKEIPLLVAPNMSIGVNLLFELTRLTAQILNEGYDIEVVETHHHHKKDAPSGTAVRLRDILLESLGRSQADIIYGREGMVGARPPAEIAIHTLRGGDVVGDHTIHFLGDGERLELTHRASSRNTFASGALRAAAYLTGKTPGNYSMLDVLHLNEL